MHQRKILSVTPADPPDGPVLEDLALTEEYLELEKTFLPDEFIRKATQVNFRVNHPMAANWDLYSLAPYSVLSARAFVLLEPYLKSGFRFFSTSLNKEPYYIMVSPTELALDCLDHELSEFVYAASNPQRIRRVRRFAFQDRLIADPLIFHTPESGQIFCTASIRDIVIDADLNGFSFKDLETGRILD